MSFRAFASGTMNYHFERDNNPDEGIFEAAAIMSALRASGPSVQGVGEGVADYVLPGEGSVARDTIQSMAQITFLGLLRDAVTMLATGGGTRGGWIAVAPRLNRTVRSDVTRSVRYEFFPNISPGAEFVELITPALVDTDMNNYGTLRILSEILWGYYYHPSRARTPMIQIELTK